MCGIVGIACSEIENIGKMIRRCLERLEYRGYDSAGIAVIRDGSLIVRKGRGKIAELNRRLRFDEIYGRVGIGHTRWATHGKPSDENAHPHTDCRDTIAVVHNGIISNYLELRENLEARGHVFKSETDTEVIAHLVEENFKNVRDLFEAFRRSVEELCGTYAIGLISIYEPSKIFFARMTSPLIIGVGDGMNMIASDIPAVLEYTNRVIVLKDGELGYITPTEIYIEKDGKPVNWRERVRVISWSLDMASKGGYPHFMLKEIHEQPLALSNTLSGIEMENVRNICSLLAKADRIFITGAGTSYHAGLVCDYLLTELAGANVTTFIASEYRKYVNAINDSSVLIAISQSGETIDTLMAVRTFKERGCKVIAVSNVVDSTIPRESDMVIYTRAGPEIGVAATKTFTTQIMVLTILSITLAYMMERLREEEYKYLIRQLQELPSLTEKIIRMHEARCMILARYLKNRTNAFYLGRGLGVPIAMEGALKLKEIAYIHAEAYPAGESKHGPIALVERDFPVFFVVLDDYYVEAIVGNVMEMRARDAYTIALAPRKYVYKFAKLCDYVIDMPNVDYRVAPIPYIIPLQLVAYYTSVMRGLDPDKPRNLAKTVTVE
ncbi:MAG: glutamine--fructose-6-phosphate transaminase (isomerizing) [Crenarchaeota archaeon]|nr:glutamine--fructose-6-phosphate transaminase (isomerizing) [Thermoproteota archaeon]